jgi:hypothetical protein
MVKLEFYDDAAHSLEFFYTNDTVRADAIDKWLDLLEQDPTDLHLRRTPVMFKGRLVFIVTIHVAGRDDNSIIIWEPDGADVIIHHLGKERP